MKLTVNAKEFFPNVREAFEKREAFTLTGAGVTAKFVVEQLTYSPTGFFGVRPSMELTLEQVLEATCSKTWDGEGLPPVGVEFERRFIDQEGSSWAWGKVIAHGGRRVFYVDRTGEEWSHSPADMEFRPIRTAEQIANDEREAALKEMLAVTGGSSRRGAKALYDAGYRKP